MRIGGFEPKSGLIGYASSDSGFSGGAAVTSPAPTKPASQKVSSETANKKADVPGFTSDEIEETRLELIGERRRATSKAPVDVELNELSEQRGKALRRGERNSGPIGNLAEGEE